MQNSKHTFLLKRLN